MATHNLQSRRIFCDKFVSVSRVFLQRNLTTGSMADVTYDQLVKLQADKSAVIVDVREKAEIDETGILPGSIHIPLGNVQTALQASDSDFESQYGVSKPQPGSMLVFSCKAGKRGQTATEKAVALGFTNAHNFEGGWLNWEKNVSK